MEHPFKFLLSKANDKENPEYWIYCHPFFVDHFKSSEVFLEKSGDDKIHWFLHQGARIGVRPLSDIDLNDLYIARKENLEVEKLATKQLTVPRDLALDTYFHYCENEMN